MPTTRVCVVVDVPADRLWAKLSEYGTWSTWIESLAESNVEGYDDTLHVPVGAVRAVGERGNPRVRERLVACDSVQRTITYEVAQEPKWRFPARRYRGTARIIALTDGPQSVIEWSSTYDCDAKDEEQFAEMFTGLYKSFIGGLVGATT